MQERRLESKYLLTEAAAKRLRERASVHLRLDPYSTGQADFSYPVHSLYLDSAALDSYWATVRRRNDRFKLRIRFYDEATAQPAYVEIKRRVDGVTFKQRCPVPRQELTRLLNGNGVALPSEAPASLGRSEVLEDFVDRVRLLGAGPKLHVAYHREAYASTDGNSLRLTFDRQVRSEPVTILRFSTQMLKPRPLCGKMIVVELKSNGPLPAWINEAIQALDLQPGSFAKYVAGIDQHGLTVPFEDQHG